MPGGKHPPQGKGPAGVDLASIFKKRRSVTSDARLVSDLPIALQRPAGLRFWNMRRVWTASQRLAAHRMAKLE
jgi:hypothetical protein